MENFEIRDFPRTTSLIAEMRKHLEEVLGVYRRLLTSVEELAPSWQGDPRKIFDARIAAFAERATELKNQAEPLFDSVEVYIRERIRSIGNFSGR